MTKRPHSPGTPYTMQTNADAEPQDGREPKRRRSAPLPLDVNVALSMKPEKNVDVVEDGDVLLVVNKFNDEEKPYVPAITLASDRLLMRAQNRTALFFSRPFYGLVRLQGSPCHSCDTTAACDRLIGHLDSISQPTDRQAHSSP